MMVTFVSQCEKKAHNRTRRVLDAFANRIGDNTWQTIITEDGLMAVKKLLRKTVTKNTAVACHWIRSRSRSDVVWIIGNRHKFNEQGFVPVNITQKDVFMDEGSMKAKADIVYANTQLQPLTSHLFAVGYVAKQLFEATVGKDSNTSVANGIFIAGCLHDLGKIDPCFQAWVRKDKSKKAPVDDGQHIDETKFSFEKHPRHNELSLLLFSFFDKSDIQLNAAIKSALKHVIYWHHAKPFRKEDKFDDIYSIYSIFKNNLTEDCFLQFFQHSVTMLKQIDTLTAKYESGLPSLSDSLHWQSPEPALHEQFAYHFKGCRYPRFKEYESLNNSLTDFNGKIKVNALNNLIRACVISADRLVSQLTAQELAESLSNQSLNELVQNALTEDSTLGSHLAAAMSLFPASERTKQQADVARALADTKRLPVLAGAAGCGKTKIALEWALQTGAKKIIWVCPRVQVCQGIFQELTRRYLPDTQIEIFTGEFKYTNAWEHATAESDYFSADIVVTTIDQILGAIITHTKVNSLIDFMDAHVVFDEYHEYIPMDSFNLLFAELVACKNLKPDYQKNCLLVSATPHYLYLEKVLNILDDDVLEMGSFNQSEYQIEFVDYNENSRDSSNPLYQSQQQKTFIISNTAQTAQLSFIQNHKTENSILLHSKFKRSDKKQWFNQVYDAFKQEGSEQYQILRSGPIVQASLNISCDYMVSEMSNAENILQRLGRLDRFGQNKNVVNRLSIAITDSVKKGKSVGGSAMFLNSLSSLQATKAWYDFLDQKLDNKIFKLKEIYTLYKAFYQHEPAKKLLEHDLIKAIQTSITALLNKVSEPFTIASKKGLTGVAKISKQSLRGDNRFVQMALLDMNDSTHPVFINQYAYQAPIKEGEPYDNLTESLSKIRNCGLVDFVAQKQAIIDCSHPVQGIPASKMTARKSVIESYARDADYPIYVSYTETDLAGIGGTDVRHAEAIYYAVCDQQPIGSIAIKSIETLYSSQGD